MIDFTALTAKFGELFVPLFPVITNESWIDSSDDDWTPEQVMALNAFMFLVDDLFNDKLVRQYNRTIWAGHKNGKVAKKPAANGIDPLRAETVRKGSTDAPDATAIFAAASAKVTETVVVLDDVTETEPSDAS
jgi:hypothetical protein